MASPAPITGSTAIVWADIRNAICEKDWTEDSRDDKESTWISQLLKLIVKYDVVRHECHAVSFRSLINQHRAGAVSRHVLAKIVVELSEFL